MKVQQENIERFKLFYNSDFYSTLLQEYQQKLNNDKKAMNYVNEVFEYLSVDPDSCDFELYKLLGEKHKLLPRKYYLEDEVDGQTIRLSADIVCGRKQIVNYHDGEFEKWILDYELIRSNLSLHFLWPKHKAPAINTYRYTKYLDRIDCLLYDIKEYFSGKETPMIPAYQQEITAKWLCKFKNDFPYFINSLQLNAFVDSEYNVLDISKGQNQILNRIYSRPELVKTMNDYMKNLLELNSKGKFQ